MTAAVQLTFDQAESFRRRDDALTGFEYTRTPLLQRARWFAWTHAVRHGTVTADDVHRYVTTPAGQSENWRGGVFNSPWFEWTGEYVHSARPEAHANLIRVYRLTERGRRGT
jgi:hypothetical protein